MKMEIVCSAFARLRGLHGHEAFDGVLMLVPCNDIHTFGMGRPIDVAFVAADGTVIEAHRNVSPNRRLRNRRASATMERFSSADAWFEPGTLIQQSGLAIPQPA